MLAADSGDQALRRIQQHAIGFAALLVFGYFAAKGAGCVFVDTGDLQGRAVHDCAMAVRATKHDGIVRRHFVQIPARGKNGRFPESFDPATSGDPLAWFCLVDAGFDLCENILKAGYPFEVKGHLAKADSRQMVMCIRQSRHYSSSVQIDHTRLTAGELFHLGI